MKKWSQSKKQHPIVDVAGGEGRDQWYKEQYFIGTWNDRSVNQGKLNVVKQEVARVNINILAISELKRKTTTIKISEGKGSLACYSTAQFSSVAQSCLTLWDSMDCSTPGFPVLHHFPECAQIYARWISDAIQPSHPLSSPSPPAFNLSQHHGLFQWVSSSHQVAKVLELQLQHQPFRWIFGVDFL